MNTYPIDSLTYDSLLTAYLMIDNVRYWFIDIIVIIELSYWYVYLMGEGRLPPHT